MKIRVTLGIGFPSAVRETQMEVDDDSTPEMISEVIQDWAYTHIDLSWKRVWD